MISGVQLQDHTNSGKSKLKEEQGHFFLKIGQNNSSIQLLQKDLEPPPGYNYRIVYNLKEASSKHQGTDLYVDQKYTIDPIHQFPNQKIIVKRLSNLYGITNLPKFFDQDSTPTSLDDNDGVPNCIKQLSLFDMAHYKSMFITQDWQASGKYILTANVEGRFEAISVDDRIPINRRTFQPIWGLRYENPWEIILIKAFAKIKGGYHEAARSKPFQFIQTFTNGTWKYFNLAKQPNKFLRHYHENNKFKNGKIIFKTKNDTSVYTDGLQPNSACYMLVNIHEGEKKDQNKAYVLTIRTTQQVKWNTGKISLFNPLGGKFFTPGLNLDHDMIMTDKQFLTYFSSAHITSNRHENYFSGYKILEIQKYQRKAQNLEFTIPKEGFFDFSIVQFPQNKVVIAGEQSQIYLEESTINNPLEKRPEIPAGKQNISDSTRFLRTKYILVRDNNYDNDQQPWKFKQQVDKERYLQTSKIRAIKQGGQSDYPTPRFTTYEIQYFKGYSKGTAHFVKLDPGRYILRIKSQLIDQNVKYAINWVCSHRIDMITANLTVSQEIDLLHDSMVSMMHKFPHFSFDKQKKCQMLTITNSFQEIGYAFASIKCSQNCSRSIIIEVDPKVLHEEGYRLKGKFKIHSDNFKKFSIVVGAGEYDSIVFKKRKDAIKYIWPVTAFNIFKKQLKEPPSKPHSQFSYPQSFVSGKPEKKAGNSSLEP